MSKLEQALALLEQGFEETFATYDQNGDKYYTCTPKQRRTYNKVVTNLKNMIGANDAQA